MILPQRLVLIGIAAVVCALAGCGSDSGAPAGTEASSPSSVTEQTTTATEEPIKSAPGKADPLSQTTLISFRKTDSEGWKYKGTVAIPNVAFRFKKDISSSPPGKAQVAVTVDTPESSDSSPGGDISEFDTVNPGRPNGPVLRVWDGYFSYKLPKSLADAAEGTDPGPCVVMNNESNRVPYELRCWPHNQSGNGSDLTEATVARLVKILRNSTPTYVMNFEGAASNGVCDVYVQDGKAQLKPHGFDGPPRCSKLSLAVKTTSGY